MGISISGMGLSSMQLSASAIGRADEAERTRRLQSIIDTLKAKPGRVTQAGIEGLCKGRIQVVQEPNSLLLMIGNEAMVEVRILICQILIEES